MKRAVSYNKKEHDTLQLVREQIHNAVRSRNVAQVKHLLEAQRSDSEKKDLAQTCTENNIGHRLYNLLHLAAKNNDLPTVNVLLPYYIPGEINMPVWQGEGRSARAASFAMSTMLGVKSNQENSEKYKTAKQILILLLQNGADISRAPRDSRTRSIYRLSLLEHAVHKASEPLVSILCEHGSRIKLDIEERRLLLLTAFKATDADFTFTQTLYKKLSSDLPEADKQSLAWFVFHSFYTWFDHNRQKFNYSDIKFFYDRCASITMSPEQEIESTRFISNALREPGKNAKLLLEFAISMGIRAFAWDFSQALRLCEDVSIAGMILNALQTQTASGATSNTNPRNLKRPAILGASRVYGFIKITDGISMRELQNLGVWPCGIHLINDSEIAGDPSSSLISSQDDIIVRKLASSNPTAFDEITVDSHYAKILLRQKLANYLQPNRLTLRGTANITFMRWQSKWRATHVGRFTNAVAQSQLHFNDAISADLALTSWRSVVTSHAEAGGDAGYDGAICMQSLELRRFANLLELQTGSIQLPELCFRDVMVTGTLAVCLIEALVGLIKNATMPLLITFEDCIFNEDALNKLHNATTSNNCVCLKFQGEIFCWDFALAPSFTHPALLGNSNDSKIHLGQGIHHGLQLPANASNDVGRCATVICKILHFADYTEKLNAYLRTALESLCEESVENTDTRYIANNILEHITPLAVEAIPGIGQHNIHTDQIKSNFNFWLENRRLNQRALNRIIEVIAFLFQGIYSDNPERRPSVCLQGFSLASPQVLMQSMEQLSNIVSFTALRMEDIGESSTPSEEIYQLSFNCTPEPSQPACTATTTTAYTGECKPACDPEDSEDSRGPAVKRVKLTL